MTLVTL